MLQGRGRLLLAVAIGLAPMAHVSAQPQPLAPRIVELRCRSCHAGAFESLAASPHAALASPAWLERTGNRLACNDCHDDADAHVRAGGGRGTMKAFGEGAAHEQTRVCLDCHAAAHPRFDASPHARAGLVCADCHIQHGEHAAGTPLLKPAADPTGRLGDAGPVSRLCTDCHEEIQAAFDFNERHRLREGVLECSSCHDPHAPATRTLLGGIKQQMCIDCHTDKGGPFVFEHPAARVEGCTTCHSPHGSPNRHLLAHQRTAELCIGCHAAVPQFHLGFSPAGPPRFGLDTQCTNCHSSIHGSNLSPVFLR